MGAMITIKYTDKIADEDATVLANAVQALVVELTEEKDTFVYADKALITVGADPIEVFIQVNAHKVSDVASLMDRIAEKLTDWKQQSSFVHSINLNVIPVEWHAKFGV